jgi:hypothetical protein
MKKVLDTTFEKQIFAAVRSAIEEVGGDVIKAGPFFGIQEGRQQKHHLEKAA